MAKLVYITETETNRKKIYLTKSIKRPDIAKVRENIAPLIIL